MKDQGRDRRLNWNRFIGLLLEIDGDGDDDFDDDDDEVVLEH